MITDAEFWLEMRSGMNGGNCIFAGLLTLIHKRQASLDSHQTTVEREEHKLRSWGERHRHEVTGRVFTSSEQKALEEEASEVDKTLKGIGKPLEVNKAFWPGKRPDPKMQLYAVSPSTVRVLQQVMMFAVPIYALQYNIPAMSMSWNTSCVIHRQTKQLMTFGSGDGVKVPKHLRGRGCVAGEGFFAIVTNQDEVWCSGGLKVSSSSADGPKPLGREDTMTGIAGKALMVVGRGPRLAIVTRAFTVRPLSALSNSIRSIIPYRPVRFIDLGYGEDYYMIGIDSVLYKTTASKRAVSTPRRVMTLCRTPVSRVASGTGFLLLIDQNGHLYSFGRNKKGQLGNGEVQESCRKPYFHEKLKHHYIVQVAAGDCHSLALTSSGVVYGSGSNECGQLGLGREIDMVCRFTPIPLGEDASARCIGIAAGPAGSMFYCDDGRVFTCGLNDSKQLGLETDEKVVAIPQPIVELTDGVESYTMDFGAFRPPRMEQSILSDDAAATEAESGAPSSAPGVTSGSFHGTRPSSGNPGRDPIVVNLTDGRGGSIVLADDPISDEAAAAANAAGTIFSEERLLRSGTHEPIDSDLPFHPTVARRRGDAAGSNAAARSGLNNRKVGGPKCGCCTLM